jgi:hypothetical protein
MGVYHREEDAQSGTSNNKIRPGRREEPFGTRVFHCITSAKASVDIKEKGTPKKPLALVEKFGSDVTFGNKMHVFLLLDCD